MSVVHKKQSFWMIMHHASRLEGVPSTMLGVKGSLRLNNPRRFLSNRLLEKG